MMVKVEYLGTEIYNLPLEYHIDYGATLKILLKTIVDQLGVDYTDFLKETTILVNRKKEDENYKLSSGDHILILQVLGGG